MSARPRPCSRAGALLSCGLASVIATLAAQAQPSTTLLHIEGALSPGQNLLPALAEAFLKSEGAKSTQRLGNRQEILISGEMIRGQEWKSIRIHARNTDLAFSCLRAQRCDLGLAGDPAGAAERRALLDAGQGDLYAPQNEQVIALDAVAIVVHPRNRVRSLRLEQLAALLSGQIRNWKAVGGSDGPIRLHVRDQAAGTTRTLDRLVLAGKSLSADAIVHQTNADLVAAVAADPQGLGYVPHLDAAPARTLQIAANADRHMHLPTLAFIENEDYVLTRRVTLYTTDSRRNHNPAIDRFLAFVQSEAGQKVVHDRLYGSRALAIEPAARDPHRVDACTPAVGDARRLSTNLRFRPEHSTEPLQLDSKAQQDIRRLAAFLAGNRHAYEAIVFGFSAGDGAGTHAALRAVERARMAAEALSHAGIPSAVISGVDSRCRLIQSDTDEGLVRNRRVEVWLREAGAGHATHVDHDAVVPRVAARSGRGPVRPSAARWAERYAERTVYFSRGE